MSIKIFLKSKTDKNGSLIPLSILAVILLASCGGAKSYARNKETHYPLIGVSTNLPEGAKPDLLGYEILDTRKCGVNFIYLSFKWSDVEAVAAKPNLDNYRRFLEALSPYGFKFLITIQTIDTNNKTLPADLMNVPFDSPEMISRFDTLLNDLVKIVPDNVKWVSLGNEVDVYLRQHPYEISPFMRFMRQATNTMHRLNSKLQVGVTCTYSGASADPSLFDQINRYSDFVSLTYYPLNPDFTVRPISDIPNDFRNMTKLAGKKRIILQEAGYPASPLLHSSDEKQAEFVNSIFTCAKRYTSEFIGVNFFLLYDFGDTLTNSLLKYYRIPDPRFRAYLATLGLHKADGAPRKAWLRFKKGYSG